VKARKLAKEVIGELVKDQGDSYMLAEAIWHLGYSQLSDDTQEVSATKSGHELTHHFWANIRRWCLYLQGIKLIQEAIRMITQPKVKDQLELMGWANNLRNWYTSLFGECLSPSRHLGRSSHLFTFAGRWQNATRG
jgi:hypothetical protein